MFSILELPLIPIGAFLVVFPLIIWQTVAYLKEKEKNKTPNVPQISEKKIDNSKVQQAKNHTFVKPKKVKNTKKVTFVFSAIIIIFVVVNVFILTFYLNKRKLSYLPRASEGSSPTPNLIATSPTTNLPEKEPTSILEGSVTPASVTPTVVAPTTKPTEIPKITAKPTTSLAPTTQPTPTTKPTLTVQPTLIAQAYTVPSHSPTTKLSPSPTQSPTATPVVTTTAPTKSIPVVGISGFSIFLAAASTLLLVLGLIL
jgi:hypothetical protein